MLDNFLSGCIWYASFCTIDYIFTETKDKNKIISHIISQIHAFNCVIFSIYYMFNNNIITIYDTNQMKYNWFVSHSI